MKRLLRRSGPLSPSFNPSATFHARACLKMIIHSNAQTITSRASSLLRHISMFYLFSSASSHQSSGTSSMTTLEALLLSSAESSSTSSERTVRPVADPREEDAVGRAVLSPEAHVHNRTCLRRFIPGYLPFLRVPVRAASSEHLVLYASWREIKVESGTSVLGDRVWSALRAQAPSSFALVNAAGSRSPMT